ncbi:MAG: hypothetical protein MN733_32685 [Nitrososphaera sp.]|nr:hypothetical protein [Nitrososphaera sp.]
MVEPKIHSEETGQGLSVRLSKKAITIVSQKDVPTLQLTNEYGNSVSYEISNSQRFDSIFSSLWQFVKESQH